MTTLLPGASEVLTHGLLDRPFSTAFLASRAAATITDGFDVLVHDVMDAMATAPWSSSVRVPSSSVTGVGRMRRRSVGLRLGRVGRRGVAGREAVAERLVAGAVLDVVRQDAAEGLLR